MSYQNNDFKAQEPLLKASRPSYGSRSSPSPSPSGSGLPSSSAARNARSAPVPQLDESKMRVKQWMASLAIALSGGVKLVHVGLQVWSKHLALSVQRY